MKGFPLDQRKKDYLMGQYDLTNRELESFLTDLFGFLQENPKQFVLRRHQELQDRKWPNSMIYTRIVKELEGSLFRSDEYTERQIRRIIYG